MAVDSLRETRHINRIDTRDLGVLWSAQAYRPDITNALRKIRSSAWSPLADVCTNAIGPGPHPTFASTGYPCLKTKNVLGVLVDVSEVDFVDPADARRWPHYCIEREDLVLNVTGAGSIGRVGMYFGNDRPLTNQHLARLSIANGTDAAFVCAFLSSWWGQRALEQGVSGSTGQLNLVNDHIRQIPIITPLLEAQRYIGDKVRQAEQLRERARRAIRALEIREAGIPVPKSPVQTARTWNAARVLLDPIRLDPKYYAPEFLFVAKSVGTSPEFVPLGSLVNAIRYGASVEADYVPSGAGIPFVRGTDLSPNRIDLSNAVDLHPRLRDQIGKNTLLEEQILITRSGTVGIAAVVTREAVNAAYGSFMMSISLKEGINPYFVAWFLNAWVGRNQIRRRENGAIQQNINIEELSSVAIWQAPQLFQRQVEKEVAAWREMLRYAERLTSAAKIFVERLIDGHLTEADLVTAQKALEAGDRSADRDILNTLRESDAPNANPLIADLDAMYSLLDESEEVGT